MNDNELERICNEVMVEYGMAFGGVYIDFAKDVAMRAVLSEREVIDKLIQPRDSLFAALEMIACAKTLEETH